MEIKKFGAIDIGSNAIRLLIANVILSDNKQPQFRKSSLVRVPIRLGADAFVREGKISEEEINAAKAASSIMAMNNIYYRFAHLVSDKEYLKMPAKLRMNIIGNPGIDKVDFELYSLAVSAINGCGLCIDSHVKQLVNSKVDRSTIANTIRISSVINAVAQTLFIN